MNSHKGQKAVSVWVVAAMIAPILQVASKESWIVVLGMGAASAAAYYVLAVQNKESLIMPRWIRLVQYAWLVVLIAVIAEQTALCWPSANGYPTIPLILLALAVLSAESGWKNASRASSIIFYIAVFLIGITTIAGLRDIHAEWLTPQIRKPDGLLLTVLLLPTVTAIMPECGNGKSGTAWVILGAAVLISAWTAGIQSNAAQEQGYLEGVKGLSLLGVVERFESLVSVAMTLGWFSLLTLLLAAAGQCANDVLRKQETAGVWAAGIIAATVVLCGMHIEAWIAAICTATILVVLPILTILTRKIKSRKK